MVTECLELDLAVSLSWDGVELEQAVQFRHRQPVQLTKSWRDAQDLRDRGQHTVLSHHSDDTTIHVLFRIENAAAHSFI